jgi:hypothetical protein
MVLDGQRAHAVGQNDGDVTAAVRGRDRKAPGAGRVVRLEDGYGQRLSLR